MSLARSPTAPINTRSRINSCDAPVTETTDDSRKRRRSSLCDNLPDFPIEDTIAKLLDGLIDRLSELDKPCNQRTFKYAKEVCGRLKSEFLDLQTECLNLHRELKVTHKIKKHDDNHMFPDVHKADNKTVQIIFDSKDTNDRLVKIKSIKAALKLEKGVINKINENKEGVALRCTDDIAVKKVINAVTTKGFSAKEKSPRGCPLCVKFALDQHDNIEEVKELLDEEYVGEIFRLHVWRARHIIIYVSSDTREKLLRDGVRLGFMYYTVTDHIEMLQCKRCCGHWHTMKDCNFEKKCWICGKGGHTGNECEHYKKPGIKRCCAICEGQHSALDQESCPQQRAPLVRYRNTLQVKTTPLRILAKIKLN